MANHESPQPENKNRMTKRKNKTVKPDKINGTSLLTTWLGLLVAITIGTAPSVSFASGGGGSGGGGGGGGVQTPTFAGNWSGTITTSFGTGAFTMGISQSPTALSGSVHFGAPIFDSTRKITGTLLNATQFSGFVLSGEGSLPITGTLSADGTTITGTVTQGEVYTFTVTRK
jgi:hypothetical protein